MEGQDLLTACEEITKAASIPTEIPEQYLPHVNALIDMGYLEEDLTLGTEYWELRNAINNETKPTKNGA